MAQRPLDARRAAERGWALVHDSEDWSLIAKMAATVAEVDATAGAEARTGRDLAVLANARTRTGEVVAEARCGRPPLGRLRCDRLAPRGRRQPRDGACYRARLDGRDDPAAWAALAEQWAALGNPYAVGRARWRQAEALLGSGEGRSARSPGARSRSRRPRDRDPPRRRGRCSASCGSSPVGR